MIDTLLPFISEHSRFAYFAIFLISLSESLALVGLLIPGTVVMFGIGAVVGMGALALKPTLVLAATGAFAGDAISYWLGHHYQERLKGVWPFNRYSRMLEEGERFFKNHGGKSVFFGRFIGPIRPVIPLVAGIMDMPAFYFTFVNITSAIAWAIAYVIPGVVLGTSLTIAGIVSTRLIILTLIVVILLWSFFWASKKISRLLILKSSQWFEATYRWIKANADTRNRTALVKKCLTLLLPRYAEEAAIFFLLVFLLVFCPMGFIIVTQAVLLKLSIIQLDKNVFYFLQSIRNPIFDRFFVVITELGDVIVIFFVFVSLIIIFLLQKARRTVLLSLTSLAGSLGLVRLFKWIFQLERPVANLYQGISAWGFPSGHTTHSAVLYGTIFIILIRSLRQLKVSTKTIRIFTWISLSSAVTISSIIGFSRLYLGAHWFSDALGGFFLGWAWVALCGLFYLKTPLEKINIHSLIIVPTATLLVIGGWNIRTNIKNDLMVYASRLPVQQITYNRWLKSGWKQLPPWRIDMHGGIKQPFQFQYVGDLDKLREDLARSGWRQAKSIGLKPILITLSPEVHLDDLPIFPRLYNGKFEKLMLFKEMDETRLVFRLWLTRFTIVPGQKKLYIGTVESQVSKEITPWITVPVDKADYITPLKVVCENLNGKNFLVIRRNFFRETQSFPRASSRIKWDGSILLVEEKPRKNRLQ